MSIADTLVEAAQRQPGAVERTIAWKFQCAGCRDEGHDHHQDNAVLFRETGKWACAVAIDGRHNRAIGEALGAWASRVDGRHEEAPFVTDGARVPSPLMRAAVIVEASTIAPDVLTWLWPGRLAVGALTNLVGLPDQGKSLLFADLGGRLTTGSPMPPAPRRPGTTAPQRVLILTLEDSLSTTMVPRLAKAGADLTRVDFVQMVRQSDGTTSLLTLAEDLDVLAATLEATRYALVVVDGITGYLGEARTHNDAEVRRVLAPFAQALDRAKVAGLSVMHPPKAVTSLAYFAGGSVAFTSVPRVTLGVAPHPDDEDENPRRVLMKIKGNLYGAVPQLAYRIVANGPADVPWLEWEPDPVHVDVADALDPPKEAPEDRSSRKACEAWLRTYLAAGPRDATEVDTAVKAAGFKARTVARAKVKVADSVKVGLSGWIWRLKP
jgi:hypothetical protein